MFERIIISFKFCLSYRLLIEKLTRDCLAYRRAWWENCFLAAQRKTILYYCVLCVFLLREATITVDSKEFIVQKSMIREIKRYQKEVHGRWRITE